MARNRKLGSLKPSRFREIAEQERRIYEKTLTAWRGAKRHILRVLGFPGGSALAAEQLPFVLTPEMEAAIDRAASWFIKAHIGNAIDAQAFAQPSAAVIDVQTPIWNGKPILPGELRTAFRVGQERAVEVTGADAPALLGIRNEDAQQQLLRSAFARLSDGARVTLGDALTNEDRAGGSIRSVLRAAMDDGKNPIQTARDLRKQFDKIEGYDWARLARTETAFSQNFAMEAEYTAEGYVLPRGEDGEPIDTPPFHPNCLCSLTIDPETGQILLDVAATACFVCQAHLAEQLTITTGRDVAPATPATAVQPEPPPWVQRRLSGEDE